jgi:hypothetical protein
MTCIAVAWIWLGFLSDNVPWFDESTWIILCSIAGGAALALARHTTFFALARYAIIATLVGFTRSLAYISIGAWGPFFVWTLVCLTTTLSALTLYAQRVGVERGG